MVFNVNKQYVLHKFYRKSILNKYDRLDYWKIKTALKTTRLVVWGQAKLLAILP